MKRINFSLKIKKNLKNLTSKALQKKTVKKAMKSTKSRVKKVSLFRKLKFLLL